MSDNVHSLLNRVEKETAFAVLSENRGETPMCSFRFRDGSSRAIPYPTIEQVNYNPSEGITLPLRNTLTRIVIRGRNLAKLRDGLEKHKVLWIQEGDAEHDETPEDKAFVDAIRWVEEED